MGEQKSMEIDQRNWIRSGGESNNEEIVIRAKPTQNVRHQIGIKNGSAGGIKLISEINHVSKILGARQTAFGFCLKGASQVHDPSKRNRKIHAMKSLPEGRRHLVSHVMRE